MVKVIAFEAPPPGDELNTVTWAIPAAAISLAGIEAVNCVLFTNVVARSLAFQRTTEPATKFMPFTIRVKAAPPAVALFGERNAIWGTEFPAALTMLNVKALETPPPDAALD